jgi:hypothetical protein
MNQVPLDTGKVLIGRSYQPRLKPSAEDFFIQDLLLSKPTSSHQLADIALYFLAVIALVVIFFVL